MLDLQCISVATDASWGNFTGWVLRRLHLQHASPRSLEVPQGTFYCKSRCGGRENKVDFPNASALAFLPGPRCSTRGFGTSVQHMSCTLLYGRNHKCVPCAYVSDNFAAARGTANLSEIYMSASPEGPFTSIANANSSVGLSAGKAVM